MTRDPARGRRAGAGDGRHVRARSWQSPYRSARLGEAPARDRVIHYVLALLVVAALAFEVSEWLRRPRLLRGGDPYGALLNDVAAGDVVAVDDSGEDYVRWQTRDGRVYAVADHGVYDLRRTLDAQPYVKANPGAIRVGDVDSPPVEPGNRRGVRGIAMLGAVALLVATGPEPRRATRWSWFWLSATGVGLLAYVLAGGSRFTSDMEDEEEPRVTGLQGFVTTALAGLVATFLLGVVEGREGREGEFRGRGTIPAVGLLDPQDHGP